MDSDEDYNDGRRRDHKFVRERNDYSTSNTNKVMHGNWQQQQSHDSWSNRNHYQQMQRTDLFGRRDRNYNNNYNSSSNYNQSNYDQPAAKRIRPNNWNEDRNHHQYESNYDNLSYNQNQVINDNTLTQPPYMSFKQFMRNLDDSIDHHEASERYNEYKFEFKRKQIIEFFNAHKDEEWFRIKYHPVEATKRKKELRNYAKHRAQVFFDLYNQDLIQTASIDIENSDRLSNILDSIVIKLEGGTDYDLKCLEVKEEIAPTDKKNDSTASNVESKEDEDSEMDSTIKDGSFKKENETIKEDNETIKENVDTDEHMQTENKEDDDEEKLDYNEEMINEVKQENKGEMSLNKEIENEETNDEQMDETLKEHIKPDNDQTLDSNQNLIEKVDNEQNTNGEMSCDESKVKTEATDNGELVNGKQLNDTTVEKDQAEPRPLHKTLSVFLRYLPANTTKEEVENLFKSRYPGFLRVALADPGFDKRFQRRGWVTFDRNVDIRKIFNSLSALRIRDCDLGGIINRDLSRRIRSVNGIASHRLNVLADLEHTAKIILNLDDERGIWENDVVEKEVVAAEKVTSESNETPVVNEDEDSTSQAATETEQQEQKENEPQQETVKEPEKAEPVYRLEGLEEKIVVFGQETKNPLLVGVEECIKEKAEEQKINQTLDETGEIKDEAENDLQPRQLERDDELIKVLDRLVFYLRVVHSLDYYNHVDYPNEDEMPNRIGIMHARGMIPTANITLKEVHDYIRNFKNRISIYLERNVQLSEKELDKLGKRKAEEEVEKFIQENTKEIKADKWLCPLSGKKFKGPNYVRKHIETKHADKLEQVKHEAEFFNLYLADSRRPQLAEHPFNRPGYKPQQSTDNHSSSTNSNHSYNQNVHRANYNQGNYNRYNNNYNNNYNRNLNNNRFNNNRKRFYRDLDAPDDY